MRNTKDINALSTRQPDRTWGNPVCERGVNLFEMKNERKYLTFWIAVVVLSIFMAVACSKDETVCYECTATGVHEYFIDTTPETMQHTIEFWAENGIELKCKQIAP